MFSVDIPELYHLAVTLDLGLNRPVTQDDVRAWVEGLMQRRVREVGQALAGRVAPPPAKPETAFSFSFDGPGWPDDEDELEDLDDEDGEG